MRSSTRGRARGAARSGARAGGCVGIIALLLAAGCGAPAAAPPGVHADPLTRIRAAVGITEATGSAHLVIDSEVVPDASSPQAPTQHVVGAGDVSFAGPDIELVTGTTGPPPGDGASVRVLRIGDAVYQSTSPPGVHWRRVSVVATNVNYLGGVAQAALEQATGPIRALGRATIDGRATIEYGLPLPGGTDALPGRGTAGGEVTVAPTIAHIWLDAAGRIVRTSVRVTTTFAPSAPTSGSRPASWRSVSTTTDTLSMFGAPVHLSAPANAG